jgi:phage tail-like protein
MKRGEHSSASQFRLVLGGAGRSAVFKQAAGLEHKGAAPLKAGTVTLKRGVDENLELWKWFERAYRQGGEQARLDGTIEILDDQGTVTSRFSFVNGWPSKVSIGAFLAEGQASGAVEQVEIAHEGLKRA